MVETRVAGGAGGSRPAAARSPATAPWSPLPSCRSRATCPSPPRAGDPIQRGARRPPDHVCRSPTDSRRPPATAPAPPRRTARTPPPPSLRNPRSAPRVRLGPDLCPGPPLAPRKALSRRRFASRPTIRPPTRSTTLLHQPVAPSLTASHSATGHQRARLHAQRFSNTRIVSREGRRPCVLICCALLPRYLATYIPLQRNPADTPSSAVRSSTGTECPPY